MRGLWTFTMTTALLMAALLPIVAAVSPEPATPARESTTVAIAQPLAAMDGAPLVAVPRADGAAPTLPESGMLVLVGSALLALAALVRRTT